MGKVCLAEIFRAIKTKFPIQQHSTQLETLDSGIIGLKLTKNKHRVFRIYRMLCSPLTIPYCLLLPFDDV